MASKCIDEAFTTRGFSNWKDAKVALNKVGAIRKLLML